MNRREDAHGDWRCMTEAEGYVMTRRPGCAPVIFSKAEWQRMPLKGTAEKRRLILEAILVQDAELSPRALNCAERGEFATLWDIDQAPDYMLLRVDALGRKTLREMRETIACAVNLAQREGSLNG